MSAALREQLRRLRAAVIRAEEHPDAFGPGEVAALTLAADAAVAVVSAACVRARVPSEDPMLEPLRWLTAHAAADQEGSR